jgi:hypothetical protein
MSTNIEKTVYYALFNAHPSTRPPFAITLGIGTGAVSLNDCKDIPNGIERIMEHCKDLTFSPEFVLLYPIYMDAMGGDDEMTMHNIAWLVKDEADKNKWQFGRTDGLTGKKASDFQPSDRG